MYLVENIHALNMQLQLCVAKGSEIRHFEPLPFILDRSVLVQLVCYY